MSVQLDMELNVALRTKLECRQAGQLIFIAASLGYSRSARPHGKQMDRAESPDTVARFLRAIPMFANLTVSAFEKLELIARPFAVPRGRALCVQGALPDALHILLEGQVALTGVAPDGTEAVVDVVHPVSHFVLAAVLTEGPYLMSAVPVLPSRGLEIDAVGLRALLHEEPTIALALLQSQAHDFRRMVRQIRDLKLRSTAQRLGCYLLALVDEPDTDRASIRLPFEKGLLAARLGCRPENLSRAFAALREHGVETQGARVTLHAIGALRDFAIPDELPDPTVD